MSSNNFEELCTRSRAISLEKGWLNPDGTDPRPYYTVAALFHSELSEALEDIRNNKEVNEVYYEVSWSYAHHDEKTGLGASEGGVGVIMGVDELGRLRKKVGAEITSAKPCGVPMELADFVIRVAQYLGSAGLGAEVAERLNGVNEMLGDVETKVTGGAEELVAQLHADVSFSLVAKAGGLAKTNLSTDYLTYLTAAIVTVFHFCKQNGVDLWGAIHEKEAFNRTRSFKHGGKKV